MESPDNGRMPKLVGKQRGARLEYIPGQGINTTLVMKIPICSHSVRPYII